MKTPGVEIGGRLGRYEILDVIGRGGQSILYKARDPKIDRIVAIKQILSMRAIPKKDRADFLIRFMRESQAAGRLSHPNIATIYDVGGDEKGEPYIAMEYVDGGDLDQLILQGHPLPQARVVDIFVQLCRALECAHDAGIVHRDIKPGNIMITRGGRVKVVDFGIARMDSSSLTQKGMIMGTLSYMSPEQIMGKSLDRRSDLFSSGVVLFQALTGEKPFVGEHWSTVSLKILNEPHASVLSRPREPALLPEFDAILDKALAKDPEARYQTCAEFGAALERLLQPRNIRGALRRWTRSPPPNVGKAETLGEGLGPAPTLARSAMPGGSVSLPAQFVPGGLSEAPGRGTPSPTPEPAHENARGQDDVRTAVTSAVEGSSTTGAMTPQPDVLRPYAEMTERDDPTVPPRLAGITALRRNVPRKIALGIIATAAFAFLAPAITLASRINSNPPVTISPESLSEFARKREALAAADALCNNGKLDECIAAYDAYLASYPWARSAQEARNEAACLQSEVQRGGTAASSRSGWQKFKGKVKGVFRGR